ncbi:MAG: hypothetical protein QOG20_5642 [Pseudonocardiales bacterium]|nr:hypothetical protein [Pseudonocardiales bacterium]
MHNAEKLARLERYGSHIVRYDVVLDHEKNPACPKNPRLSKVCHRVEMITGRGKGPKVRAEACGPDFHAVLDAAVVGLSDTENRPETCSTLPARLPGALRNPRRLGVTHRRSE